MRNNGNLNKAKAAKNDEFYTRLEDIEKELKHYTEHFKGKVVYCNCDDANRSNFFKYFSTNFQKLGLKKLITSGLKDNGTGVVAIQKGNDIDIYDGNGDFHSEECIEFLKEADIVVTNPPFSLFREYVAQLMQYGKKFLIIGNMSAIAYKEIFPYIKNNELWMGYKSLGSDMFFNVPQNYVEELKATKTQGGGWRELDGIIMGRVATACWFTNLEHKKRNEELILYKHYNPAEYQKYENYNAIEVSKVAEIPMDYEGVMGVPISFLDKYCPNQFRILGLAADKRDECEFFIKGTPTYLDEKHKSFVGMVLNHKATYARLLIQKIN